MVKINLLSIFAFAFSMMAGTVNAQVLWGVGSGSGVADAEFQNAFVNSTTAGSYSATQWTALAVSEGGGTVSPGNAYWVRNLTGLSQGGYAGGMTVLASPSQANGAAMFDSDFMDNGGVQGAFGTGTSPSPHMGELISPRIDLTGATNTPLVVKFHSYYRRYSITTYTVSFSTDDGATWAASADIQGLQPVAVNSDVEGQVNALFTTATNGVANLTQCRIKFTFDGDYYYALLDDISIEAAPNYNIALGLPNPGGTLLVDEGDYVKIGGNQTIPYDNVDATDLTEWFWGGKVVNMGAMNMYIPDSAAMHLNIDYIDPLTGAVTAGVYRDTMYFDTLIGGSIDGQVGIEYLRDLNFIISNPNSTGKPYLGGDFEVTYWVTSKATGGPASDDTVRTFFTITPGLEAGQPPLPKHNYLSKARLALSDGNVYSNGGIFPGGGPFGAYEYGSVYYFPQGGTKAIGIDSVHFRYHVGASFTGAASQTLLCNVYQVDAATSAVLNASSLLTQVGVATVALNNLTPSTTGFVNITGFVDAGSGGPMANFVDGGFYFVSILTNPGLFGGPATFGIADVPYPGGDRINYYMNAAMTDIDAMINPSPVAITDAAGTTTWYWTGFGADVVPSLGLYLKIPPYTSVTTINTTEGAQLSVYPNPTSEVLNVNFTLETADDVMYIMTDMTGRVVNILNSKNVTNETQSIDVSGLASGVYMITAKTSKGTSTERF
jgi:hypothetical protein